MTYESEAIVTFPDESQVRIVVIPAHANMRSRDTIIEVSKRGNENEEWGHAVRTGWVT